MGALRRWRELLEGMAIPEEILARAPEDPWLFPAELFRAKAEAGPADTPSRRRAQAALPEGGSVLDVGAGAGAASLAFLPRAGLIVAVDPSEESLRDFERLARRMGVAFRTVAGRWPDVAREVDTADVVVCHHVLYNVPDLRPFVEALSLRARRRVVVELTEKHPVAWMTYLWRRFHGFDRPEGPTAEDCVAALGEVGIRPRIESFEEPEVPWGYERREEALAAVRRRLCLPAERDSEIEEALGDRLIERSGSWRLSPSRRLVTLSWDP